MLTVERDMKRSASAFADLIWPAVRPLISGGDLVLMESVKDSEFAKMLDIYSGIDGWQLHTDGMRGISSRVQVGTPWDTFTVRMTRDSGAATEFEKRKAAIMSQRGWLYPYLHIQAYLATWTGPILSVGVVKMADLIKFIDQNHHRMNRTTNATFAVCGWRQMRGMGYALKILRPE